SSVGLSSSSVPQVFFPRTSTSAIYALSLHDALPICSDVAIVASLLAGLIEGGAPPPAPRGAPLAAPRGAATGTSPVARPLVASPDRKSTRLNSSHVAISYAVFCLKKKRSDHPASDRV